MRGLVIKSTGSSYIVRLDDGTSVECYVKGNFRIRGIRSTNPVAVGDYVVVESQKSKVESSYFPSYEIVMDELRDYRFYADDRVHPSSMAVEYIWERFCETFCTSQTINAMHIAHKEWKFAHHRPLHEA